MAGLRLRHVGAVNGDVRVRRASAPLTEEQQQQALAAMPDLIGETGVGSRQPRFRIKADLDRNVPVLKIDKSSGDAARLSVGSGHREFDFGEL